MKRLVAVGILALVTLLLAAACGGAATPAPAQRATAAPVAAAPATAQAAPAATIPPTPAAKGEKREVHFFEVNALTGQSASYGTRSIHGVELAAKHVNDAGGFTDSCGNTYTIKLTVFDMANSREQAIAGLRKAADDPTVLASIGSTPSTGFVPMVPVAGQLGIAIIATGSAAPIKEWNPYAFRVTVTSRAAVPPFMKTMREALDNFNRVAIIYDITQDGQRGEAELIRDSAGEFGYQVVAFEAFRANDKDFRAQLTTIKATNPDWVGIYGATPEGTAIINQMSEIGMKDLGFFAGFGSLNQSDWWDLTEGKVKGGVNWAVGFDLTSDDPLMKKVTTDYAKAFPEAIDVNAIYGYQALQAYVEAVKKTCSATDRAAFRDALAQTDKEFIGGPVKFDSPRDKPLGENLKGSIITNRVTAREIPKWELVQAGARKAKSEKREVHFFEVNALTGQSASFGTRSIHGVELAAKHINDAGGFTDSCGNTYTIKLTVHDMANIREQAIAGLRKAADDPSVLVSLGSTPSTGYVPMVPVAGQVKLPIISTGSAAPIKEWNPYAFRVTVTSEAAAPQLLKTMVTRFDNFKRVALIYDITQDGQRGEAELIRDRAGEFGYQMVAFEAFRAGDKDFRSQLTTIRAAKPNWVGVYAATPEGTAIINQMSEIGLAKEAQFFTGFGVLHQSEWWDLTEGKIKGGVNWSVGFNLQSDDPLMKKVTADYGKIFPEGPDVYSIYGYQALQTGVEAVKKTCSATDREAFRDALAKTNIKALGGSVIFDSPRDKPLGENRTGTIFVSRITGRGTTGVTEYELIPLAK